MTIETYGNSAWTWVLKAETQNVHLLTFTLAFPGSVLVHFSVFLCLVVLTTFELLADKQAMADRIKQQMVCDSQRSSSTVKSYFSALIFLFSIFQACIQTFAHIHKHTHTGTHTRNIWGIGTARQARNLPRLHFIFSRLKSCTAGNRIHLKLPKNVYILILNNLKTVQIIKKLG